MIGYTGFCKSCSKLRSNLRALTIMSMAGRPVIGSKVRALESAQSFERLLVVLSAERIPCGRRILKHRSACGSGYPKLATHYSATYSAMDSDFLQTSIQIVKFGAVNTKITFISIFMVILKVKFKGKGKGTGCLPEITSACVPKRPQTITGFPGQLTQALPFTWLTTIMVKFKVKGRVPDIVPKIT